MRNDPIKQVFWWRALFIAIGISVAVWAIWLWIAPLSAKLAVSSDVQAEDDINYQSGFYQTAVAGFMAYEGNEIMAEITYYTPRRQENDNHPTIMASGEKVFKGAIACPDYLDFGAKVEIDGWEHICHDRMNQRYRTGNYFDVFTFSLEEAIQKGREIKIVKLLD